MPAPKKLIEVALPVKEISAESVRDKSIRHGHISTLHLWWARRPLPVCRAVVFASLVPDPLDPHCPQAFRDAVELLLGKAHNPGDPYRPYADIPWTAVYDPMEDNLRNRLQMFIGKFSDEAQQAMLLKKTMPPAGKTLSDFSLIKWDNKNNEEIINKARKLIWVANSLTPSPSPGGRGERSQGKGRIEGKIPLPETLLENARSMRKDATDAEAFLWELLRDRKLNNLKFRRQHPIREGFILDFYCHEAALAVELDGGIHLDPAQKQYDEERTAWLNEKGIRVIRFWNHEVLQNPEQVLQSILEAITPLPPGEGPGVREKTPGVRENGPAVRELLTSFDHHYAAIKNAEAALYAIPDRHLGTPETAAAEAALHEAIEAFLDHMPRVFDPFAGGGAIPLEAARLGCRSYGNDINPVAHIIQKGSLEFPQRYGKPITYTKDAFIARYGQAAWDAQPYENRIFQAGDATAVRIPNRLAFDVDFYARELLRRTEAEIGHYYPYSPPSPPGRETGVSAADKQVHQPSKIVSPPSPPGRGAGVPEADSQVLPNIVSPPSPPGRGVGGEGKNTGSEGKKPIAYYWARVGTCSNPSCRAEVPLLKGFYLCNKPDKKIHLKPVIEGKKIEFEVGQGTIDEPGWNERANLRCPICGAFSDTKVIKKQFYEKKTQERLLAVIEEGEKGKIYRLPTKRELEILGEVPLVPVPKEMMPQNDSMNLKIPFWGFKSFGDMFTPRQLLALHTLVEKLGALKAELKAAESDYGKAVATYLGIWIDRLSAVQTSFGRWDVGFEKIQTPFARQAIPMIFDFPEGNIFSNSTGSASNHIEWITRYIESEGKSPFGTKCNNASSGDKTQFEDKYLTSVVTDPPYYDAIAYADLSDFFYVWLKRTVSDIFPLAFSTPQTPKSEECTALKHHQNGSVTKAKAHFEEKLMQIFDAIEHQTSDIVSIMFAHQSTEAWTTLCNSIIGARMNITGSWAMDTEMANRAIGLGGAALASSVTVSCRPAQRSGIGDYKTVKKAIEARVAQEVEHLYTLGFRGADLLTACFGQAVSEFGQYQAVEKADGSRVTVADLLEMARESAFNALLKGFQGDDFTKFYIAWLQLYGFAESDFDDAAKFSRVGLTIDVQDLFREHILLKSGNKQVLGGFEARLAAHKKLGDSESEILINQVHRALYLYRGANRGELLRYLARVAAQPADAFWRVLTSLCEVLPAGSEDLKQAQGLLTNKDSLLRESREADKEKPTQTQLDL